MPIPPTKSDTRAITNKNMDIVLAEDLIVSCIWARFLISKSLSCVFPMWCLYFKISSISFWVVSIISSSWAFTVIIETVPGKAVPKTFFWAVVIGINTKSSWSCPIPDWPLVLSRPITLNGIPPIRIVLLIGSISPKSSVVTVWPKMATFVLFLMSSGIKFLPASIS